jgi:ferredoxin
MKKAVSDMREILFRGKREDNGEWVYGNYCAAEYLTGGGIEHLIIEAPRNGCATKIIPETVGQYTGLTDKNGNKIFEGDIIQAYTVRYVVEMSSERGGYFPFACGDGCGCCECEVESPEKSEVIGNIHDNPELLKGE